MTTASNSPAWDSLVEKSTGHCYFMQSENWAKTKQQAGWNYQKLELGQSKTPLMVYSRRMAGFGPVYYVPKAAGLTVKNIASMTNELRQQFKGRGVVLKLELDQPKDENLEESFHQQGWQQGRQLQYTDTVLIDLTPSVDEIFASFKKRARYEARVAEKSGVKAKKVEPTKENFKTLYDLMETTTGRSRFLIRNWEYSWRYWQALSEAGQGSLYFAEHEGDVIAAAFIIQVGKRAYYKDGGSTREQSKYFASRLLLWEIMKDLKKQGCSVFDLMGVTSREALDAGEQPHGYHTFKVAFARDSVELERTYDLPLNSRYKLWRKLEPKFVMAQLKFRHDPWY